MNACFPFLLIGMAAELGFGDYCAVDKRTRECFAMKCVKIICLSRRSFLKRPTNFRKKICCTIQYLNCTSSKLGQENKVASHIRTTVIILLANEAARLRGIGGKVAPAFFTKEFAYLVLVKITLSMISSEYFSRQDSALGSRDPKIYAWRKCQRLVCSIIIELEHKTRRWPPIVANTFWSRNPGSSVLSSIATSRQTVSSSKLHYMPTLFSRIHLATTQLIAIKAGLRILK